MSSIIETIGVLINEGRFRDAVALAEQHKLDPKVNGSAHFYFTWSLAKQMLGVHDATLQEQARRCGDYTILLEGDFHRDMALHHLRRNELERMREHLSDAQSCHSEDKNRLAVIHMVRGRLFYAERAYEEARWEHVSAQKTWDKLRRKNEPLTTQWEQNNRVHWMRTDARLGVWNKHTYAQFLAFGEPRLARRVVVRMYRFGRPGVMLADLVERILR